MLASNGRCPWHARHLLCAVLVLAAICSPLSSNAALAWRTWVGDDTAPGGSGTWNNSNLNWSGADAGTAPYYAWGDGDRPKFFGPEGTVTVEGTVKVYSEFYIYTNYVFTGGTIGTTLGITLQIMGSATVTVNAALSTRTNETLGGWGNIAMNNTGTLVINSDLTQYNFNGNIVPYKGKIILNGDNYSAGTVAQNDTNQTGVFILNGTHYNAGSYTIREIGGLGGTGTVQLASNSKLVNVSGTLTPGTETQIGTLTIAVGDLKFNSPAKAEFQVDLANNKADKVVVGDQLTYGGALNLRFTGSSVNPASFQLLQFGSKATTPAGFASTNVFGLNPLKATVSYNPATGVLTYTPIVAKGALILVR